MDKHVELAWIKGYAWQASTRGYTVVADTALEPGSNHMGMTPVELMVSALGMCMSMDLSYYAEHHPGIDLSQVRIDLTWEDAPDRPSRVGVIRGRVVLPDHFSDDERAALIRVLASCKVRRTIERSAVVEMQVLFGDPDLINHKGTEAQRE